MSNRFRNNYRKLSEEEKILLSDLKREAGIMEAYLEMVPDGREKSTAMTKLEEAVMWAVKGITG